MSAPFVAVACALLIWTALMSAYAALFGAARVQADRIIDMAVKMRVSYGGDSQRADDGTLSRALFRWIAHRLPARRANTRHAAKLAHLLMQAGYLRSTAPRDFQVVQMVATVGGALLAMAATIMAHRSGATVIVSIATGAAVGAFLPSYWLARKARKRQREIARELSDVLDLLVVCAEAGLGLSEAIKVVGSEAEHQKQAIGAELALVSGELAAGSSLGQALRQFADRTAVEDVKPLAATLIQSEQIGAQIGPALRSISDSLRTARRLRAEEAAQKTTVKILFPLVLFVLPAMMSVIVGPAMIQIMRTLSR